MKPGNPQLVLCRIEAADVVEQVQVQALDPDGNGIGEFEDGGVAT